jgi:hypothetical protein
MAILGMFKVLTFKETNLLNLSKLKRSNVIELNSIKINPG